MHAPWPWQRWKKCGKRWACVLLAISLTTCSETEKKETSISKELEKSSPVKPLQKPKSDVDVLEGMTEAQIRTYMINFSRDLDVECSTCHDDSNKKLINHVDISRSMIHLSRTFNVQCKYCHQDLKNLTEIGEVAREMKEKYSDPLEVPCTYCHLPETTFKLNKEGLTEKRKIEARKRARRGGG